MKFYNIVFRPEPEGGFTIMVPSLPGCLTWAPNIETGKVFILEAIQAYLESFQKDEYIEDDSNTFVSAVYA